MDAGGGGAPRGMILGLTGSVGSGKTFVSSLLECSGATVVCADKLSRAVVAPGEPAHREIVAQFGPTVVGADGQIDRVALARIVFGDPRQRQILEAIIHPRVRALERQQLDDAIRHKALVVFDVPLLYENGLDGWCDTVVVVTVDEPTRRARLAKSRGMTAEQVDARLASQMPQAEKAARAAHVIDNSGTRRETLAQVRRLLEKLFPSGLPPGLNLPGDHCLPPQDPA